MQNFDGLIDTAGWLAAVTMPLWNIPLVVKVIKRKSAKDISLLWLFGIWLSILLMLPASLKSTDSTLKSFSISNAILFSFVVVVVMMYRKR